MTIELIIDPKGIATLQTKGIAGPGCRDASRWLEAVIGHVVTDHATAEFHQVHIDATHAQRERA